MTKLCKCGCGQKVSKENNRFIHGHQNRNRYCDKNNPMYGKKHSKETREKISKALKGRKLSKETLEKRSKVNKGKNNPMYGRKHSEESKNKMSKAKIGLYKGKNHYLFGKHLSDETKKKMSKSKKGKPSWNKGIKDVHVGKNNPRYNIEIDTFIEKEQGKHFCKCGCNKVIKILRRHYRTGIPDYIRNHKHYPSGENHPKWNGGSSFEPYCIKFNKKLRDDIRNKYNRKCLLCGKNEKDNKKRLSVHHIDYNKDAGCDGNSFKLVPLCASCHSKTNNNRNHWTNKIIKLINQEK